jgi:peptide/nickel transport system permease protein
MDKVKQLSRLAFVVGGGLIIGLAFCIVTIFFILAMWGNQIAPYDFDEDAFSNAELQRFTEPDCSWRLQGECQHPFGTDRLGRDVFSRVILGTHEIFRVAGFGTLVAVIIGTAVGLTIGYYGGWVDEIVGRLLDSMMAIPVLILALVLIGVLGDFSLALTWDVFGLLTLNLGQLDADDTVLLVLIIVYSPIVARVVRSNALEIKSRRFIEAAKLRGESTFYILTRETLPLIIPTLVVEASLRFSYAIFLVASLGYLGLGTDPTTSNWGFMIFNAYNDVSYQLAPWTVTYPTATIAILIVSLNITSDGIKRLVQRS